MAIGRAEVFGLQYATRLQGYVDWCSAHIESAISPLSAMVRIIRRNIPKDPKIVRSALASIINHTQQVLSSEAAKKLVRGAGIVTKLPSSLRMIARAPETRNVLTGTASILSYGLTRSVVLNTATNALLAMGVPLLWVPIDISYFYFCVYIASRMAKKVFEDDVVYTASLLAAIYTDRKNAFAADIEEALKTTRRGNLDAIVTEFYPSQIKDRKKIGKDFNKLFYKVISLSFAEIFSEIFSDQELARHVFSQKNSFESMPDDAVVKAKFASYFSAKNIRRHINKTLQKYLNEYNYSLAQDFLKSNKVEAQLKAFFDRIPEGLEKFIQQHDMFFAADFWTEHSKSKTYLSTLPSKLYHSKKDPALREKISGFYGLPVGPLSYFLFTCFSGYLISSMSWLAAGAFEALFTGRLLLKQKTAMTGMTESEANIHFANNKIEALASGAMMIASCELLCKGLSYLPGGNFLFLPLAVYYTLLPLFSAAMILDNEPVSFHEVLPPEKTGYDPFEFFHALAEGGLKHLNKRVFPELKKYLLDSAPEEKKQDSDEKASPSQRAFSKEQRQSKKIDGFIGKLDEPNAKDWRIILLGNKDSIEDLDSFLKAIAKNPAINLYMKLYGDDISAAILNIFPYLRVAKVVLTPFSFVRKHLPGRFKNIIPETISTHEKLLRSISMTLIEKRFKALAEYCEEHRIKVLERNVVDEGLWEFLRNLSEGADNDERYEEVSSREVADAEVRSISTTAQMEAESKQVLAVSERTSAAESYEEMVHQEAAEAPSVNATTHTQTELEQVLAEAEADDFFKGIGRDKLTAAIPKDAKSETKIKPDESKNLSAYIRNSHFKAISSNASTSPSPAQSRLPKRVSHLSGLQHS